MSQFAESIAKVVKLVQGRIDGQHITLPRAYQKELDQATINRIGMSVYLESDEQVESIGKFLQKLSDHNKATGERNPIIVKLDTEEFVVASVQLSTDEKNFSKRPKVLLSDNYVGGNAEVSKEDALLMIRQLRERQKDLKMNKTTVSLEKAHQVLVNADENLDL